MVNYKTLVFCVAVLVSLIACNVNLGSSKEGKGPLTNKIYNLDFTGIEQDNGIDSKVHKSTENKVVVNAPSDIIDNILVEMTDNKVVHIHVKKSSNISTRKVKVDIYTTALIRLDASSAASIRVIDTFLSESIQLETTSGAEIKGSFKALKGFLKSSSGSNIQANLLTEMADVEASSGSEIGLSGLAKNAHMKASSGAQINGENFNTLQSDVQSSSGAQISTSITNKASAKASSGSNINLYRRSNDIEISKEISSGGSVHVH